MSGSQGAAFHPCPKVIIIVYVPDVLRIAKYVSNSLISGLLSETAWVYNCKHLTEQQKVTRNFSGGNLRQGKSCKSIFAVLYVSLAGLVIRGRVRAIVPLTQEHINAIATAPRHSFLRQVPIK